jgi:predicted RNase H-like HicB family nuclease
MNRKFTLEYWIDEGWYVGRLKEVPGVFSQGETLDELEENINDAYKLMIEEMGLGLHLREVNTKEVEIII